MQSNRLIVTLNKEMQIGFERGLNQVYENSNLVNEFVVKPSFLLETGQSMLVTFKNAKSNATLTLKPTLLAKRAITAACSDEQAIDNDVAQMQQTVSSGYEYFTMLSGDVMRFPGEWYFSIQICQLPEGTSYSDEDITKLTQVKTSDIAGFTVYSSLAGAGPNGSAPSDFDVLALYQSAESAVAAAAASANNAATSATEAKAAVVKVEQKVDSAVSDITDQATQRVLSEIDDNHYATHAYVNEAIANSITTALNTPV